MKRRQIIVMLESLVTELSILEHLGEGYRRGRYRRGLGASDVDADAYDDEFKQVAMAIEKALKPVVAKGADKLPKFDDEKAVKALLHPIVDKATTFIGFQDAELEYEGVKVDKDGNAHYEWKVSGVVEASVQTDVDDFDEARFNASGMITISIDSTWEDPLVEGEFDSKSIDDSGPDDY